jgi:hypothetical protein
VQVAKSARNGPQGAKIRLSTVDPLSKSGIGFFGVILAAKHYMNALMPLLRKKRPVSHMRPQAGNRALLLAPTDPQRICELSSTLITYSVKTQSRYRYPFRFGETIFVQSTITVPQNGI